MCFNTYFCPLLIASSSAHRHLSSRALTQKLRAFATRRTDQRLGPSIRLLRAAIVAVVLAVCALSIGRYVAVDRQLNAFQVCACA